jgi:hypothetical protein
MCNIPLMRKFLILFIASTLIACAPTAKVKNANQPVLTPKGEKIQEAEPTPGDIKTVDGVQYIYAKNRRFQLTPYEPEYLWVRKDEYSPGLFESLAESDKEDKKARKELETRVTKLEEELKKKAAEAEQGTPALLSSSRVAFSYPSPKMKRRILVLPLSDLTNYKDEHLNDVASQKLIFRLENTGAILCVDPKTISQTDFVSSASMRTLYNIHGIQAVIKGALSDVFVSTSRFEGKDEKETSVALSKISFDIINTETGKPLRELSARNPVFLSRERGEMSAEKAKLKAIDLALELLSNDLLKAVLSVDWHARIVSVEGNRVFVNAGRLTGLEKGDVLEVYGPGDEIFDKTTNAPLGRVRGEYKGEMEVTELFGVDASWATTKGRASFSPVDLVYLKKK